MMPGATQRRYGVSLLIITAVLIWGCIAGEVEDPGTSDRDRYSVGDTRIISMDLTGCYGTTLTVYKDESFVNATLYGLSKRPSLNARDTLNHSLVPHQTSGSRYAYFYLYPGSNVSITACSTSAVTFNVYIIKGIENFTLWRQTGKKGSSVVAYACIVAKVDCAIVGPQLIADCAPWPKTIQAADDWYFVSDVAESNVWLYIHRYEYLVKDSDIISSCNAGGSKPDSIESCTVAQTPDVSTYLLKIGSGKSTAIVEASTTCAASEGPNVGMSVSLAIFVVATVLLAIVLGTSCYCFIKRPMGRKEDEGAGEREPLNQ